MVFGSLGLGLGNLRTPGQALLPRLLNATEPVTI
jgi:hypothetical protein